MFQRSLLTDTDIGPLADGVLTTLEDVGVLCQNEEILKALEAAGARVDRPSERACFPRGMVNEFVDSFRKDAPQEDNSGHARFTAPYLPRLGMQLAQFFHDYEKGERRRGSKADFITLIKLGDTLHPDGGVGHCLLLTDVPPLLEPLEAAMLLAEYAHRPQGAFAWNVRQVDYLIEMGGILGIEDWFTWGAICFAHPLRFDRDVADRFVRQVKSGVRTGLTAMTVAGRGRSEAGRNAQRRGKGQGRTALIERAPGKEDQQ